MKRLVSTAEAADYISTSTHSCVQCGENLIRTPRRPIDRLLNLFVPVERYRCRRFSCQWAGNIRIDDSAANTATVTPR